MSHDEFLDSLEDNVKTPFVPVPEKIKQAVTNRLGFFSRMLSFSKSAYSEQYPNHLVVFNSNVVTKTYGKIWWGDIDVTESIVKLMQIAALLKEDVYVLYEMDGRFENEKSPKFSQAPVRVTPEGDVVLCHRPAYDPYRKVILTRAVAESLGKIFEDYEKDFGKTKTSQRIVKKKTKQEGTMPTKSTKGKTKAATKKTSARKSTKKTSAKKATGAGSRRS